MFLKCVQNSGGGTPTEINGEFTCPASGAEYTITLPFEPIVFYAYREDMTTGGAVYYTSLYHKLKSKYIATKISNGYIAEVSFGETPSNEIGIKSISGKNVTLSSGIPSSWGRRGYYYAIV